MTPRLFLMLMGVDHRHSFCSVFQKLHHFDWSMNAYDFWDDEDTVQYPAWMQAFILTQVNTSTAIETFCITLEEDMMLTDDDVEHLPKYLINAKTVDFMGSIKQVL